MTIKNEIENVLSMMGKEDTHELGDTLNIDEDSRVSELRKTVFQSYRPLITHWSPGHQCVITARRIGSKRRHSFQNFAPK